MTNFYESGIVLKALHSLSYYNIVHLQPMRWVIFLYSLYMKKLELQGVGSLAGSSNILV